MFLDEQIILGWDPDWCRPPNVVVHDCRIRQDGTAGRTELGPVRLHSVRLLEVLDAHRIVDARRHRRRPVAVVAWTHAPRGVLRVVTVPVRTLLRVVDPVEPCQLLLVGSDGAVAVALGVLRCLPDSFLRRVVPVAMFRQ